MRILVSGGLVIDPSQNVQARRDLLIEDGKIRCCAGNIPLGRGSCRGVKIIDAKGRWVLPGLIDMHVHLREPGREADETLASGTRAAARGGVTTVLAMPNTSPVIDTAARVRWVKERAKADGRVHVLVAGAVTRGQSGGKLAALREMADAGAAAFTDDGHPLMDARVMLRALECARDIGLPVLDHCEDLRLSDQGVMHEGEVSRAKRMRGIPAASESLMAMRDVALAERTGGRLHVCHVSCAETVEIVRRAKERGVPVTAETAPHYFSLTDADIPGRDADFKMNPPLRTLRDVAAVRKGLADGTIDAVATDHAPHAPARKALGFRRAPFGIIGLETLLPLALLLVEKGILSRKDFVQRVSCSPARILGLTSKGGLKPGMDADVAVVDPKEVFTVEEKSESKSRNTPFKGWKLKGRAVAVIVGGKVAMEHGELV